jgi:glutamyl-Q tRNA(Asp) synthetase
LAAVGSYLDARANGARWLVRIEDLDTPRVVPGCADAMLRTLEAFGFEWDGEVLFQSTRRAAYADAIATLTNAGRTFACSCSRKDLAGVDEEAQGYPGTCRSGPTKAGPTALRFHVRERPIHFDDLYLGPQHFDLAQSGDVVVQRRDGIASYQLAVVVDDAFQGVTRVVRGADLLSSTRGKSICWMRSRSLRLSMDTFRCCWSRTAPNYPKRATRPQSIRGGAKLLISTLTYLSQAPPPDLADSSIKDVWNWAVAHWRPQALAGRTEVRLSARETAKQNRKVKIVGCKKVY